MLAGKSVTQALRLADKKAKAGQLDEAEAVYSLILQKYPGNREALRCLQEIQSSTLPDTTLQKDPPTTDSQRVLAAYSKASFEEARTEICALLVNYPESVFLHNLLGATYAVTGKPELALQSYQKALAIKPDSTDALINLGNAYQTLGNTAQAIESYKKALQMNREIPEAYNNLGNSLVAADRFEEAIRCYEKAVLLRPTYVGALINLGQSQLKKGLANKASVLFERAIKYDPRSAIAYCSLGNALKVADKTAAARKSYLEALQLEPRYPEALNNLGNLQRESGDIQEAIALYRAALKIEPDNPSVLVNLGVALESTGETEAAENCYQRAAKAAPDSADPHINLGNLAKTRGDLIVAVQSYKKAIQLNPENALALNNLGNTYIDLEEYQNGINCYHEALTIDPRYSDALNNFGIALQKKRFSVSSSALEESICLLLDSKNRVRPREICNSVVSLVKCRTEISILIRSCSEAEKAHDFMGAIRALSQIHVLMKLMRVCPIADLELERVFIRLRAAILLNIDTIDGQREIEQFQIALALQCYTNEYLYYANNEESKQLRILISNMELRLADGDQPSVTQLLCVASYLSLGELAWMCDVDIVSGIAEVNERMVKELAQELQLRAKISALAPITDTVSIAVRSQYEESPYPRWVNLWLSVRPESIATVSDKLNLELHDKTILGVEAPQILIAGCGTGQHPISVASRFKNSKVLAVDLSLNSLAYAKRKALEFEVNNLDFLQADILNLEALGRQFDVIESGGVLHHMADPEKGWAILTKCLRRGGLMKIALYSEAARADVLRLREHIAKNGIESDTNSIKLLRNSIANTQNSKYAQIRTFEDFYSLSEFRDLAFHVQEHRFTLMEISEYLEKLGLKFCGFESPDIVKRFLLSSTDKSDQYDLKKWAEYEGRNPLTFSGMYQFWCQKV